MKLTLNNKESINITLNKEDSSIDILANGKPIGCIGKDGSCMFFPNQHNKGLYTVTETRMSGANDNAKKI